jgi:dTDP-4-amino-4,6-dideoxygalactose transaminase
VIILSDIKVPIAKPIIGEEEIENVVEVLKSGMIAQGPKVEEFEQEFADWVGAEYGIAVNSGTAALHVALLSCDIGPGDEVITTPFTFIASGNSIVYTGAEPVFADIDLKTYTLNPDSIEDLITENTKAIMPVQLYGQSADMDKINSYLESKSEEYMNEFNVHSLAQEIISDLLDEGLIEYGGYGYKQSQKNTASI